MIVVFIQINIMLVTYPVKWQPSENSLNYRQVYFCRLIHDRVITAINIKLSNNFDVWQNLEYYREFADILCEKADILLYPCKKSEQEFLAILERFVDVIASLAFIPGGITIFGNHYEVKS